ncbi:uncharacterized protein V6R79_009055 [Siganus canaliculatus]
MRTDRTHQEQPEQQAEDSSSWTSSSGTVETTQGFFAAEGSGPALHASSGSSFGERLLIIAGIVFINILTKVSIRDVHFSRVVCICALTDE